MSAISRSEVEHLARLARIDMSDEELDRMAGQLDAVLDAVAAVAKVATDDVPATSHPVPLTNVTRPTSSGGPDRGGGARGRPRGRGRSLPRPDDPGEEA